MCSLAGLYSPPEAHADTIAYWDFNTASTAPTSFNSNLGAVPSLSVIGGVTSNFATGSGSGDPTQPGQGFNTLSYPAQGSGNKSGGVQFNLNTSNFDVSNFTFDWRSSNSSSRWMAWQYTLNGTSWLDGGSFSSSGGDQWNNGKTVDLSGIAAADNNANFGLRLVAMFSPDGFTQVTAPNQTFGPNAGYRAANVDDRAYASTSTWRFDSVTLNGTYNDVAFSPANLTWNSSSGNWDTNGTNKPWLNPSAVASPFAQAGGKGDNVAFNNPAPNSVVTVQAGGVTPNSTTVTNSATLTFTGGAIGGTGGLVKNGIGRLILANGNTFTSANSPSSINGGVVETRANNGLGGGTVSIGNAIWTSTTTAQTANNLVNLTGPVTFQTDTSLTINNGLSGSGVVTKTGAATLGIAGVSSNAGSINLTAGTTRLDSMGALGGLFATGVTGSTININTATLVMNATGSSSGGLDVRLSDNVTLNNGTISRNQLTAGLGPNPTNGDSELSSYANGIVVGGTFTVSGNSTIANLETRTAGSSDIAGGGGSNNAMVVRMPVLVTSG
ncbi:MAG: hypothetical protein H7Z14_21405, partial [Anaerolineae bacterium]|nr:hypothetical protein [Phycisphaerae bacterium]